MSILHKLALSLAASFFLILCGYNLFSVYLALVAPQIWDPAKGNTLFQGSDPFVANLLILGNTCALVLNSYLLSRVFKSYFQSRENVIR